MRFSNTVTLITCLSFLSHSLPVAALDLDRGFTGSSNGQSEYFNSNRDKRMLIQVNFLSGVARPGLHQVPDNTNLLDAISLAGGLTQDADFENVLVKRRVSGGKDKYETLEFDVEELVEDSRIAYPALQNYDTIFIEPRPKTEQRLLTVLTILASTVGIVSGVILIRNANE